MSTSGVIGNPGMPNQDQAKDDGRDDVVLAE